MKSIYDQKDFFDEYAKMSRSQKGLNGAGEWHQLQPLFPNLKDKVVLDLGCGYGWHCQYAVDCEAQFVLGIDVSQKMIDEAKKRHHHKNIEYHICDLEQYEYPQNHYDLVISNLVLHYIEDLESIYRKVYQTLKPGGIFLFNIEHPVFTGSPHEDWIYDENNKVQYWPIDNYFYPGERITRFLGHDVKKYHHTLTQIIMGLIHTNFQIEVIEEAMPPENMLDVPGMKDEMRRPMMLLVKARKS